jgi:cytochrome c oxidase subunit 2
MTSQDVIHDFFVPAFRVKKDVLPGRYTTLWFEATKPGAYHLFCAQYCGTQHSGMIGHIIVMEPAEFQAWLSGGATGVSMATAGENLFQRLGCATCHMPNDSGRGPSLVGLLGKTVRLQRGGSVSADENYVRESILNPQAKLVAGYPPIMPTFKGLVSEDGIMQILAYLKSLKREEGAQGKK